MTPKDREELAALEVKLIRVFIGEAQPESWPGMDTDKDRGNRYWFKKNASATGGLVMKIQTMLAWGRGLGDEPVPTAPTASEDTAAGANDPAVIAAKKQAKALMSKLGVSSRDDAE